MKPIYWYILLVIEVLLVGATIALRAMPLLIIALALPLLMYLLFKPDEDEEDAPISESEMDKRIALGKARVEAILKAEPKVPSGEARIRLLRICALAERIFDNFEDDPGDLAKAGRFLMYLDRFLPLVERYARLSSTPEGRELLSEEYNEDEFHELLETAEEGFSKGFKNYLANDVVEMKFFGKVLKRMMDVAEVGK
ncbi:MAG: hypothetical protein D6E12_09720 [Desulfovibrio sp.]|nr:MAG: hypothetical protein D6E12_09720 [Desulfovibrio sp.]